MGVVYNMVGGNGSDVVAFLIANYPSGATCTATCNGETLTGSGNTQSAFAIPFMGTWRVTITDQGQSAYKDVVVSDNLQYTVSLSFKLYLIQDGKVNTDNWTSVLLATGTAGGGETTVDNVDYYRIYNSNTTSSTRYTNCYFTPKQAFPVDYTYLVISAKSRGYDNRPFGLMSNYGAVSSAPTYYKSTNMKDGNTTVLSDLTVFILSLSDVTSGEYWFGFSTNEVSSGGLRTGEVLVRDFYLTNELPN